MAGVFLVSDNDTSALKACLNLESAYEEVFVRFIFKYIYIYTFFFFSIGKTKTGHIRIINLFRLDLKKSC